MKSTAERTGAQGAALAAIAYFGPLAALLSALDPVGPFFDITMTSLLKERLHASAAEAATFRLLTALPVYASCLFGFARDRWRPFGWGDRGHLLVFGLVTAAVMGWLALQPLEPSRLLVGVFAVMLATRFLMAAFQGALARHAQSHAMSGRLAALWQFASFSVTLCGAIFAGVMAERSAPGTLFTIIGLMGAAVAAYACLRPPGTEQAGEDTAATGAWGPALRRLARHRAIYPAVIGMLLFQFSPAQGVVLQYYLVEGLGGSRASYGYWYAAFLGGFLPMFPLYGYLCARIRFDRLLRLSACLAIPQMLPLLAADAPTTAVWLAVPVGMLGGLLWAALHDLAIRASPCGLQGTLMMVISGVNVLGVRAGDLVGSHLYGSGGPAGFLSCVLLTTAVYGVLALLLAVRPPAVPLHPDGVGGGDVADG